MFFITWTLDFVREVSVFAFDCQEAEPLSSIMLYVLSHIPSNIVISFSIFFHINTLTVILISLICSYVYAQSLSPI